MTVAPANSPFQLVGGAPDAYGYYHLRGASTDGKIVAIDFQVNQSAGRDGVNLDFNAVSVTVKLLNPDGTAVDAARTSARIVWNIGAHDEQGSQQTFDFQPDSNGGVFTHVNDVFFDEFVRNDQNGRTEIPSDPIAAVVVNGEWLSFGQEGLHDVEIPMRASVNSSTLPT